jgi:hypothetical protein
MAIEQEGDTLTLSEEGTLSLLLSDMAIEKRIKNLTLRGPINWADLRVLIASEGRLEGMESLDLKEVTLVSGGEYYASYSYFGDGIVGLQYEIIIVRKTCSYKFSKKVLTCINKMTILKVQKLV